MEKDVLSILVIDPDSGDRDRISDSLARSKIAARLKFVSTHGEALRRLEHQSFDLILTEHHPPRVNVLTLLLTLKREVRQPPVIVIARDQSVEVIREAFKLGVADFILKEELDAVALFHIVGTALEKKKLKEERLEAQFRLKEMAEQDGLTGLYNHRWFLETLEREFSRSKRYWRPLSILMIDLDGFKMINDTCGHLKGDQVLKDVAFLLRDTIRSVDSLARYGGDEFSVILPETDAKAAIHLGERLLQRVKGTPFVHEQKTFPLSTSVGVGSFHPQLTSAGTLIAEADRSLYQAKREGRGRVVYLKPTLVSGEPQQALPISIAAATQIPETLP